MRHLLWGALAICATAGLAAVAGAAAAQELKPEKVGVATLAAGTPRLYVADIAIGHIVDGRMHVLDGGSLAYLGLIGTGMTGMIYVPAQPGTVYVATSYYEKLARGRRSDFLEIYDAQTLRPKAEIPISTKRAQALNYRPLMFGSHDGKWMFIQNATPATSIAVVDMTRRRMTAEVPNPGCYGIYPSSADGLRFATLCGDGTIASYTLAAGGASARRKASAKIFDVDQDALFSHAERDAKTWLFLSYPGNLYRIDIEGETANLVERVPLAAGVEGNWRPSGYQPFAYHPATGVVFALMHKDGAEGTHKNPAEEVWAFDVKAKKLLSRSPTATAFAVATAQGAEPVVYVIDGVNSKVLRYGADKAKGFALTQTSEQKVGETPIQLETQ